MSTPTKASGLIGLGGSLKRLATLTIVYTLVFVISFAAGFYLMGEHGLKHTPQPAVILLCQDESLAEGGLKWQAEVHRRFSDAVVFCSHGQDCNGIFMAFPQGTVASGIAVTDEIKILRAEYGNRTLVFLCCNPQHIALHGFPNVYYSSSSTWVIPDRNVLDADVDQDSLTATFSDGPSNRWATDPSITGNVWEMVSAE